MTPAQAYDRAAGEIRKPVKERTGPAPDLREMIRFATLAASSHNTQPWKFRIGRGCIEVLPDFSRRCPVVDPDDSHLFKSLGCAAENLVHAAAAQGYQAETLFNPLAESVGVLLEPSPAAQGGDLFQAITVRQCTKTLYDGQPLAVAQLRRLEQAGQGPGVRTVLLTEPAQIESVVEYVNQGNLAQLSDPAFRQELVSWIRFNPSAALRKGDGLAGRTTGQPALPTWLAKGVIRFVLTPKAQADLDARNIRSSSAIAIFVSARDDKEAWVETGRAYERFALQAAALEIRNAFLNQPIEVRSLRPQFESWLGLKEEKAQLMVRIGRAPLAPYSLRRPLEEFILAP